MTYHEKSTNALLIEKKSLKDEDEDEDDPSSKDSFSLKKRVMSQPLEQSF